MDGNYTSTLDLRIPDADLVIFLDYPRTLAFWRALKRRFQYQAIQRPDMPEGWKERIRIDLFIKIVRFKKTHKPRIIALLSQKERSGYIIFKSPKQTESFLKN